MKKNFSKTIMVILAVLLTLVLISTSTVSGIFAKYVVEKNATTIVSLKKFGVKLAMSTGSDYSKAGASLNTDLSDSTISVTVDNIQLVPGDSFPDIIRFTASVNGTVSVNTRIKVKAVVNTNEDVDVNKFKIGTTIHIPIEATVKKAASATALATATKETIASAWQANDFIGYQTNITSGLRTKLGADVATGDSDYAGYKIATAGKSSLDANAKGVISFGFAVPATEGDNATEISEFDEIITQIAENEAKMSITYYVSLEQIV